MQAGLPKITDYLQKRPYIAIVPEYPGAIYQRDLAKNRVIHTRHSPWPKSGVWERVFKVLAEDADNEYAMIDATIVRVHQHSAGTQKKNDFDRAIGRSKGGLRTKTHATCDALGNPTGFYLTAGQVHDLEGADVII